MEKIKDQGINNIDIATGSWPQSADGARVESHDFILASHSMYGVRDFKSFVQGMINTAKKGCIMVMRAPLFDSVMAAAALKIFGQPYDSPNFQIAYNILLEMDIFADVIMEADGTWPGWQNDSFEQALDELKNRMDLLHDTTHDDFLTRLLKSNLTVEDGHVIWPAGNRSALVFWEV